MPEEDVVAPLRIILGEDSVLLREALSSLLTQRGFDVVAQAGDAQELIRKTAAFKPDVAIVDIRMPPTFTDEGLRAAEEIGERLPGTGVLVLSQHLESEYAVELLEGRTHGRGYLLKDTVRDADALVDAVQRVAAGEPVVDSMIVSQLIGRRRTHDPLDELTERERETLSLMAEGRSNRAIAARLFLSDKTVESHVRSIFRKLGLDDRPDDHRRVLAVIAYLRP